MKEAASSALGGISVFALLVVRGLLLWIVIPVGFIAWLLFGWVLGVGRGQFLGWVDLNLIALQSPAQARNPLRQETQRPSAASFLHPE